MTRIRSVFHAAWLALGLLASTSADAQTKAPTPTVPANISVEAGPAPGQGELDYAAWERLAGRVETAIADSASTVALLEQMRAQVADWRAAFLAAQGTNAARIATLRGQIDTLGPVPAEGATDAPEIAVRRSELTDQLVRLQAPVIAAEEAYSRADGLIREIDRTLREKQASELLRVWPMPVNPANWPDAWLVASQIGASMVSEVTGRWQNDAARAELRGKLPAIAALLLAAVGLTWRGRRWFERLPNRLLERSTGTWREVWAFVASLGQIVVPTLGVLALSTAVMLTGMVGPITSVAALSLALAGFILFSARWLGFRVFPRRTGVPGQLNLAPERMREGRLYASVFGFILAFETVRSAAMDSLSISDAGTAVLSFPMIALAGIVLFRVGSLLRPVAKAAEPGEEMPSYRNRMIGLVAGAAMVVGVLGPLVAALGYVSAGQALVYPAIISLGLLSLIAILQRLVGDIFAALSNSPDAGRDSLTPVLVGFALALLSIPLFALIWGARLSDISEVFTRLGGGFQLGQTRISPTNFLTFLLVFGIGFLITRALQGALRSSILPKTKLDQGGQNAVISGVSYIGIFLAGLIAIDAAGIDLTGLAFVAGALSLGIGFGLQNIVQNFVSGIILLIERPVSEGDWIEVGGVQGTVKSISVRSTRIQTFDRTDVIVPNADLVSGQVTNWTRFNLTGRLIVKVGVAYGTDTRKVERILHEIAEAQPLVVLNPKPMVVFQGFGADSLDFDVRMILRDVNFSLSVRTEVNHAIAARFAEEGIEIPFAQRDIWLRNPEALRGMAGGAADDGGPAALVSPDTRLTGGPSDIEGALPQAGRETAT